MIAQSLISDHKLRTPKPAPTVSKQTIYIDQYNKTRAKMLNKFNPTSYVDSLFQSAKKAKEED